MARKELESWHQNSVDIIVGFILHFRCIDESFQLVKNKMLDEG